MWPCLHFTNRSRNVFGWISLHFQIENKGSNLEWVLVWEWLLRQHVAKRRQKTNQLENEFKIRGRSKTQNSSFGCHVPDSKRHGSFRSIRLLVQLEIKRRKQKHFFKEKRNHITFVNFRSNNTYVLCWIYCVGSVECFGFFFFFFFFVFATVSFVAPVFLLFVKKKKNQWRLAMTWGWRGQLQFKCKRRWRIVFLVRIWFTPFLCKCVCVCETRNVRNMQRFEGRCLHWLCTKVFCFDRFVFFFTVPWYRWHNCIQIGAFEACFLFLQHLNFCPHRKC